MYRSSNQHTPTRGRTPPRPRLYTTQNPSGGSTPRRAILEVISPQVINRRLFSNEVPIQMEEEVSYGNICQRREFNFEEAPAEQQPEKAPGSLFECISNGVLHMDRAAKLIWDRRQQGDFNQAIYDEFVSAELTGRASLSFDGLYRVDDPQAIWHNFVALRLQGDINKAVSMKNARCSDFAEGTTLPNTTPHLSMENCRKVWNIDVEPPFAKVELTNVAANWQPRKNDGTFQQITSLFRFVLLRITSPPEKIQEFSIRVNRKNGRNDCLENLPEKVELTLIDFAEDCLGYGYDELKAGFQINREESSFYKSLGSNENERKQSLEEMARDRKQWRSHLFKALQKALRDVRSYEYDRHAKKWKPSNRQSKRAAPQADENPCPGDEEDTEDYRRPYKLQKV